MVFLSNSLFYAIYFIFRDAIGEVQGQLMQQREYGYDSIPNYSTGNHAFENGINYTGYSSLEGGESFANNELTYNNFIDYGSSNNSGSQQSYVTCPSQQSYSSSMLVLPSDIYEEDSLHRIRYKLENLYPAQRDFVVAQLMDKVSKSIEINVIVCLFIYEIISVGRRVFAQTIRCFSRNRSEARYCYIECVSNHCMFALWFKTYDINILIRLAEIFRAILLLNDPVLLEYLISKVNLLITIPTIITCYKCIILIIDTIG